MDSLSEFEKKTYIKRIVFTCIPLLIILLCFTIWLVNRGTDNIVSIISALVCTFLFSLIVIRLVPQWQRTWSGESNPEPLFDTSKRAQRASFKHPIARIVLTCIVSRLLYFILGYVCIVVFSGYRGPYSEFWGIWNTSLGKLSLQVAQNGYSIHFGTQIYSCFPLYPLLISFLNLIIRDYFTSGMVLSNLFFIIASIFLYELVIQDSTRASALRAVRYMNILPPSILFLCVGPYSLLLLLSILSFFFIRKKKYHLAAILGMFASFTHFSGVLLFFPLFIELTSDCISDSKFTSKISELLKGYLLRYTTSLLIPAGFIIYLLLAYKTSGAVSVLSPLNSAGSESPTFFIDAASKVSSLLITGIKEKNLVDLICSGIPGFMFLYLALFCIVPVVPKIRTSVTVYALLYFILIIGTSNPVSIPLLFLCCFPYIISVSINLNKKWLDIAFSLLFFAGSIVYLYAFSNGWLIV